MGPKPQLDPPEPILATNPLEPNLAKNALDTKMAIEPIGPIFGHGPPWTIIPATRGPRTRTKFHNSNSRSQNPTPISKEDSSTHQSGNPWQQSEDHSRIPITWPCRSWVALSFRIILREFPEVIQSLNQFSRHHIFQYSLDNSIGPYRRQSINLYVLGPIGTVQSSTVGIQSHSSIPRWPELYWPNSDNTASDPPSRISLSVFHIYWPPFSTWALFPQSINILDLLLSLFSFTLLKLILIILSQSFSTFSLFFLACQWILVVISFTNSISFSGG
ncbi:hypothetical protein O181_067754 [Austropuccinia psidii MF-1]|uniref:Uncharacterized protein n=1 Tax=Austropuccinia psidii MF-1 TaxID=1389203 RepID=A0A9Q3I6W1_9BASI|nr:hypothetical protein [Austropuccinia psidii MF-1]